MTEHKGEGNHFTWLSSPILKYIIVLMGKIIVLCRKARP